LENRINIKLAELRPNQEAYINDFEDDLISLKLMEMGLLPGEKVKLIRYAPMGDPMMLELDGYFLTLRREDAININVSVIGDNI